MNIESIFWKIVELKKTYVLNNLNSHADAKIGTGHIEIELKKLYNFYKSALFKQFGDEENANRVLECGKTIVDKIISNKQDNIFSDSGLLNKQYKIIETLFQMQSKYQYIQVFKTMDFGNILVIDGDLQLTERDEYIYHEMFVHVPMSLLKNPKKVLIIGGGDGGIATELLKYPNLSITQIEIDEMVVQVCTKYFPQIAASLDKINLFIQDASVWINSHPTNELYDLILMDTTDFNASNPLFVDSFFEKLVKILKKDGLLVFNGIDLNWAPDVAYNLIKQQHKFFKFCRLYQAFLPMYGDGHFSFVISAKDKDPANLIPLNYPEIKTRYYDTDIHIASFKLPKFLKELLYKQKNKSNTNFIFGYHVTIDMEGVDVRLLDSETKLLDKLKYACAQIGKLKIVGENYHKFSPQGVTAYLLLATSHASIHTWPEYGKCAIDIFTCGNKQQIINISDYLVSEFKPTRHKINTINRTI